MTNQVYETKKAISATLPTKRNDLYNSTMYWSQKAFNICDILVEKFTKPGDIVFDPFLGSGVTLFESIKDKMKRNAIGCEINDPPIFMINTILESKDKKKVNKQFEGFIRELQKLNSYYTITCPSCKKEAIIRKTLFDIVDGKIVIKQTDIECSCGKHSVYDSTEEFVNKMNVIESISFVKDVELIANSKIAVKEGQKISSIFTKRNFIVLDKICGLKRDFPEVEQLIEYTLLSIIHLCKITDTHSNSQWPLWIPSNNCVEKNVVNLLEKKMTQTIKAIDYVKRNYKTCKKSLNVDDFNISNYKIIKKGIQNVSCQDIPDDSVDLVITDPPYLGQVPYSEYMQLYLPFFNFTLDFEDEIVVSSAPSRKKTEDEYFNQLNCAFATISKKMKKNSYLCLYFHDANLSVWNKLIQTLEKNGFHYISQVHIKKSNTVKNNLSPKKSMNGDALLFFIKENIHAYIKEPIETDPISEIEHSIIKEARAMISEKGKLTTTDLYDNGIMEILIHNNWLEPLSHKYSTLVEIFERFLKWDKESSCWKLN